MESYRNLDTTIVECDDTVPLFCWRTVAGGVELLAGEAERVIGNGARVKLAGENRLPAPVRSMVALDQDVSS